MGKLFHVKYKHSHKYLLESLTTHTNAYHMVIQTNNTHNERK